MNIRPLHDWVVIEPSEGGEKTAGGLYIPDTAKEKPQEGKVLAVGKGRWEEPEKAKWGKKPKERRRRSSNPRSSSRGTRSYTRSTRAQRSIWTGRRSFSSGSLRSSDGSGRHKRRQENSIADYILTTLWENAGNVVKTQAAPRGCAGPSLRVISPRGS